MRHAGAEAACGADEIAVAGDERGAAHQPRRRRPADQHGERYDPKDADLVGLSDALGQAELMQVERGQHDQQRQERQRDDRVGAAHQYPIGPAAEIARGEPDKRAERRRGECRRDADDERYPAAAKQPYQDIAAQLVGAERVHERRPGQPVQQIDHVGIDAGNRPHERRGKRCSRDRKQQKQWRFHR